MKTTTFLIIKSNHAQRDASTTIEMQHLSNPATPAAAVAAAGSFRCFYRSRNKLPDKVENPSVQPQPGALALGDKGYGPVSLY